MVLGLARLGPGRAVAGQPVKGLQLFGGDSGRGGRARWRREIVGAGPDDPWRGLGMRADRRVPVRYPVGRAGAVVGCRSSAVAVHRGAAEVEVRRRGQMMMVAVVVGVVVMVAAGVRRRPPRVGIRLDGGASGDGPVGALRVGARRSRGHPSRAGGGGALDHVHGAAIVPLDLDPLQTVQAVLPPLPTTADDRVDAEADLRLRGHRNNWRRRERHHRTIIVRPADGLATSATRYLGRVRSAACLHPPRPWLLHQTENACLPNVQPRVTPREHFERTFIHALVTLFFCPFLARLFFFFFFSSCSPFPSGCVCLCV